MRVQSIWTAIEPRHPARDRFLGFAIEMASGKMYRVTEFHHFAQKIGAMAETFQNARHLLAPRLGAPLVVDPGRFPRRIAVFDQLDFGSLVRHARAILTANSLAIYHGLTPVASIDGRSGTLEDQALVALFASDSLAVKVFE